MSRLRVWHPIFIALFPVLSLYAYNSAEIPFRSAVRSILACIALAIVVWLLFKWISKDAQKAALLTSVFLLLFFSYGHVLSVVNSFSPALGRHRYLLPLWILLFALSVWVILGKLHQPAPLTRGFNVISTILVVLSLAQVGVQAGIAASSTNQIVQKAVQNVQITATQDSPDIYYIILDMYGRSDVLQARFNTDNRNFLARLKEMGFYVADCSLANYPHTVLSIASSLNMSYLNEFTDEKDLPNSEDSWFPAGKQTYLGSFIRENAVRLALENAGYRSVSIETSWNWLNAPDADDYFTMPSGAYLSNFEEMFVETTLADVVWGWSREFFPQIGLQETIHRQRFILGQLPKVPALAGPKFVFVHIGIPHPPFVFASDGSTLVNDPVFSDPGRVGEEEYIIGYANSVAFIDQTILPILEKLISTSSRPPVIILQGDHGPGGDASVRNPIFNAYYLPGEAANGLYPTITPVNSFRVVFDRYFGTHYGLLEDTSYSNPESGKNFKFEVYQDTWSACSQNQIGQGR